MSDIKKGLKSAKLYYGLDSYVGLFKDCENLESVDLTNVHNPEDIKHTDDMLSGCTNLESINMSNLNTSGIETASNMFKDIPQLSDEEWHYDGTNYTGFDLTEDETNYNGIFPWSNSSVVAVYTMITGANVIPTFNEGFNYEITDTDNSDGTITRVLNSIESPTELSFQNNSDIITVGYLDTSKITTMDHMFYNCGNLVSIDASGWNTSNVTSMNSLFFSSTELESITGIGNWDTSSLEDLYCAFKSCYKLKTLDLSNWDTSNVTNMTCLFEECYALSEITGLDNLDVSKVQDMGWIFSYCESITSLTEIYNWVTSSATNMAGLFTGTKLTSLDLSKWDTSNVTEMWSMFEGSSIKTIEGLDNWDISSLTRVERMFNGCTQLTSVNLSTWNTSNISNTASKMFKGVPENVDWHWDGVNYANWTLTESQTNYGYEFPWNTKYYVEYTISPIDDTSKVGLSYNGSYKEGNMTAWYSGKTYLPTLTAQTQPALENNEIHSNYTVTASAVRNSIGDHAEFEAYQYELQDYEKIRIYLNNGSITNDLNTLAKNVQKIRYYYPKDYNVAFDGAGIYENDPYNHRLTSISYFNTSNFTTLDGLFNSCEQLTTIDVSNYCSNKITSLFRTFNRCTNLTNIIGLDTWDTSNVTGMTETFKDCKSLKTIDISNWNISKVTDLNSTFIGCSNLTDIIGLESREVDSVTSLSATFKNCSSLTSLDLSNWNVKLTGYGLGGTFEGCTSLTNLNLSSWDTKDVIFMGYTFKNCTSLTSLNLSGWDTSSVTYWLTMFTNVPEISVLGWNYDGTNYTNFTLTEEQTGYAYAFPWNMYVAEYTIVDRTIEETETTEASLPSVAVSAGDTLRHYAVDEKTDEGFGTGFHIPLYLPILTRGTDYSDIVEINSNNIIITLNDDSKSNSLDTLAADVKNIKVFYPKDITRILFTGYDSDNPHQIKKLINLTTDNFTSMNHLFYYAFYLEEVNTSNWNTSKVTNMDRIFRRCEALRTIDVSMFNTENVSTLYGAFRNDNVLENIIGLENWDTKNVITLTDTFRKCPLIQSLNIGEWDVSKVESMEDTFRDCNSLTTLDVSEWDTKNVTNMNSLFRDCNSLTTLDVSKWVTSSVTNMDSLFRDCNSLTTLDLSKWDTSKVTDMSNLFNDCNSLSVIDVSNWNVDKVTDMHEMFDGCPVTSLDLRNWNTTAITNIRGMFDSCTQLQTINGIENFKTENLTIMYNLFYGCNSLKSLDLSNWNVSKVTDFTGVFAYCYQLSSLNISTWNTSNVENMYMTFCGCRVLGTVDVSNWNVSNVTNLSWTFSYCHHLKSLDLSKWDVSNVTTLDGLIYNCSVLEEIDMYNITKTISDTCVVGEMAHGIPEDCMIFISSNDNIIKTTFPDKYYIYRNEYTVDTSLDYLVNIEIIDEIIGITETSNTVNFVNNFDTTKEKSSYLIDWGDGTLNYELSHEYETAGSYTIRAMERITDGKNIQVDTEIGKVPLYSTNNNTYERTTSFKSSNYPYENFAYMCYNMGKLTNCDLSIIDTSKAKILSDMFYGCKLLTSIDGVEQWDISNAEDIRHMFFGCTGLTSLDLSGWDTRNANCLEAIFYGCTGLTSLNVANWDVSNVENMNNVFYGCTGLTSLNVANWDTHNVKYMYGLFHDCSGLTSLDVANWDTHNVTDFGYIFESCSFSSIDISKWSIESATNISGMFSNCTRLTSLDLSHWDTSKIERFSSIFVNCTSLTSLNVSTWDVSNANNVYAVFKGCKALKTLDLNNWSVTNKAVYAAEMFRECETLTTISGIEDWDLSGAEELNSMFYNCYVLRDLDVSNWNTSTVTNMSYMFSGCEALTSLDLSNWDTSSVTAIRAMFNVCSSLTSLDVSTWDTSKVTDMGYLFGVCTKLPKLDISKWDVSNVTNMEYFICNCHALKEVDMYNVTKTMRSDCDLSNVFYGTVPADCMFLVSTNDNKFKTTFPNKNYIYRNEYTVDTSLEYADIIVDDTYTNNTVSFANFSGNTPRGYLIDWGDGTLDYGPSHTYTSTGSYTIKTMEFPNQIDEANHFVDFNVIMRTKHVKASNYPYDNFEYYLIYGVNLESGDFSIIDTSKATSLEGMFSLCYLTEIDLTHFNTSNVTNMQAFLANNVMLESIDVSNLDVSKVTSMDNIFANSSSLTSIVGIDKWQTDSLESMSGAFMYCESLTSLNLSNWNISKVSSLANVFNGCNDLQYLNLSNWDTSNVTEGEYCFAVLNEIPDWGYDGTNYANWTLMEEQTGYLFIFPWNLTQLTYTLVSINDSDTLVTTHSDGSTLYNPYMPDIRKSDLIYMDDLNITLKLKDGTETTDYANVTVNNIDIVTVKYPKNVYSIKFQGLSEDNPHYLKTLESINTDSIQDMSYMFSNCIYLEGLNASVVGDSITTANGDIIVATKDGVEYELSSSLSTFNTSNVTDMSYMFYNCSSLISLDVSNWDTSKVNNMCSMFYGCSSLTSIDMSSWDTSNVTDMSYMFNDCGALVAVKTNNNELNTISVPSSNMFNTSKVTSMSLMFNHCYSLVSLDVSNWDVSSVVSMPLMFNQCTSLTSLDVSNWDTRNVKRMECIFSNCFYLTSLDVSNWDVSNVTNMEYIFEICTSLTSLDLSKWNINNVQRLDYAFHRCESLKSLNLSTWNTSNVTSTENMFGGLPTNVDWGYDGTNYSNFELTETETSYSSIFPWNE